MSTKTDVYPLDEDSIMMKCTTLHPYEELEIFFNSSYDNVHIVASTFHGSHRFEVEKSKFKEFAEKFLELDNT
jgi:hypothetical protein